MRYSKLWAEQPDLWYTGCMRTTKTITIQEIQQYGAEDLCAVREDLATRASYAAVVEATDGTLLSVIDGYSEACLTVREALAQLPAVYRCIDDRYDPEPNLYTEESFLAMCKEAGFDDVPADLGVVLQEATS